MFSCLKNKSQESRGGKERRTKNQELFVATVFFLASCLFSLSSNAQCAMCRAALEGEGNIKKAEAVNDGIVYLMMIPYVLMAAVGFFIFRMYQKKKD